MIKLKLYSLNTNIGTRSPKQYILGGKSTEIVSKNGVRYRRRLNEELDSNLGKELKKLQKEKYEINQGLGGGNTMATYKLKRFSRTQKTYTLKRKSFGVVGNAASGVGSAVNKTVGTVENVAGGVASGTGKAMDSFVGKNVVGAVGGGLAGLALAPKIGALIGGVPGAIGGALLAPAVSAIGGLAGHAAMKGGGSLLKGVGESLKDDAASRTA